MTDPIVETLVEHIARRRPTDEVEAFRADLDAMGDAGVRATYGVLMRQVTERERPGVLDAIDAPLTAALHSPLGNISESQAAAVTASIGVHRFPDLSIRRASAAMMVAGITQVPRPPLIETLLKVSDGHWPTFIREQGNWARLVWTVPGRPVEVDFRAGRIVVNFRSPVALYLAPGFWLGLLEVFGLEPESVEIEASDAGYLLDVSWGDGDRTPSA